MTLYYIRDRKPQLGAGAWAAPSADLIGDVLLAYIDFQVGQSRHDVRIELAHSASSVVMFVPWLVVITRGVAEGREDTFQVMLVLQPDVLLNGCDASRLFLIGCICACQSGPPSRFCHAGERLYKTPLRRHETPLRRRKRVFEDRRAIIPWLRNGTLTT